MNRWQIQSLSFPRKRESMPAAGTPPRFWMPAFAGMTWLELLGSWAGAAFFWRCLEGLSRRKSTVSEVTR